MPKLFIPWRWFFRSLSRQPAKGRKQWLTYFSFDDPGVTLIPEVEVPQAEILRETLPPAEEQEQAVLSALAERKRTKLLH
jgi:hypothetical protein